MLNRRSRGRCRYRFGQRDCSLASHMGDSRPPCVAGPSVPLSPPYVALRGEYSPRNNFAPLVQIQPPPSMHAMACLSEGDVHWWGRLDLNQRRLRQRIYSPPPLTTRALPLNSGMNDSSSPTTRQGKRGRYAQVPRVDQSNRRWGPTSGASGESTE